MHENLTAQAKAQMLREAGFGQEKGPAGANGAGAGQSISDTSIIDDSSENVKEKPKPPTQAEALLGLVEASGAEFFTNTQDEPYAAIRQDNHREIFPLCGKKFKFWLSGVYYKETAKSVNNDTLQQVMSTLSAKAIFDSGEPIPLHTRIAKDGSEFWYDLSCENWQAVHITSKGWSVKEPPIMFKRFGHQKAQVMPQQGGNVRKILNYIPLEGDFDFLLLVWVISSLIPDIPHPAPIVYGEKGAAKTTVNEFLKMLIDPSSLKTLHLSSDQRNLAVNLDQHHFLPFDNISYIICRDVFTD